MLNPRSCPHSTRMTNCGFLCNVRGSHVHACPRPPRGRVPPRPLTMLCCASWRSAAIWLCSAPSCSWAWCASDASCSCSCRTCRHDGAGHGHTRFHLCVCVSIMNSYMFICKNTHLKMKKACTTQVKARIARDGMLAQPSVCACMKTDLWAQHLAHAGICAHV